MSREQDLAQRRTELVERSAAQRAALIVEARPLLEKAAALDRLVTSVRRHPLMTALAASAVVFAGGRRLLELGTRLLTLYALVRR